MLQIFNHFLQIVSFFFTLTDDFKDHIYNKKKSIQLDYHISWSVWINDNLYVNDVHIQLNRFKWIRWPTCRIIFTKFSKRASWYIMWDLRKRCFIILFKKRGIKLLLLHMLMKHPNVTLILGVKVLLISPVKFSSFVKKHN